MECLKNGNNQNNGIRIILQYQHSILSIIVYSVLEFVTKNWCYKRRKLHSAIGSIENLNYNKQIEYPCSKLPVSAESTSSTSYRKHSNAMFRFKLNHVGLNLTKFRVLSYDEERTNYCRPWKLEYSFLYSTPMFI